MRITPVIIALLLLPVMAAVHVWEYTELKQRGLATQAEAILQEAGVRGATVDLRYLDLSVTGDAPDVASLQKAVQALQNLAPLRLVNNRLSILARLRARLDGDTLALDGWLPNAAAKNSLITLLQTLRPDLSVVATGLNVAAEVRWPEGEAGPLTAASPLLKPIVESLRVPPSLEIRREVNRLVASGMVPTENLKQEIIATLGRGRHGLAVDAAGLKVTSHTLPASFVDPELLIPFLRSYYSTPSPGLFSISLKDGPRLQAPATRTLESGWLTLLRPMTGGTKVDMELSTYPSIFHFPGRKVESEIPAESLKPLQEALAGFYVVFPPGGTTLAAAEKARLIDAVPLLLSAGPGLRLFVGGHPDLEGQSAVEGRLAITRAEQVVAFLVEQGVPAATMQAVAFDPVPVDSAGAPGHSRSVELLIR